MNSKMRPAELDAWEKLVRGGRYYLAAARLGSLQSGQTEEVLPVQSLHSFSAAAVLAAFDAVALC